MPARMSHVSSRGMNFIVEGHYSHSMQIIYWHPVSNTATATQQSSLFAYVSAMSSCFTSAASPFSNLALAAKWHYLWQQLSRLATPPAVSLQVWKSREVECAPSCHLMR